MLVVLAPALHAYSYAATPFNSDPRASYAVAFTRFPGYTGPFSVSGVVKMKERPALIHTQKLFFQLMGVDPACHLPVPAQLRVDPMKPNSCGLHIHTSTDGTCKTAGGHYYNPDQVPTDPWTNATYSDAPMLEPFDGDPWRFPDGLWNPPFVPGSSMQPGTYVPGGAMLLNNQEGLTIEKCTNYDRVAVYPKCPPGSVVRDTIRPSDPSALDGVQVTTGLTFEQASTGVLVLHDRNGVKIACSPIVPYSHPPSPPPGLPPSPPPDGEGSDHEITVIILASVVSALATALLAVVIWAMQMKPKQPSPEGVGVNMIQNQANP
jgi:hypothetical protein